MSASFLFPPCSQDWGFADGNGHQLMSVRKVAIHHFMSLKLHARSRFWSAPGVPICAPLIVGARLIKLTFSMGTLILSGIYFLMERQYPTEHYAMKQICAVNYLIILAKNLFEAQAKAVWNAALEKNTRSHLLGLRMSQIRRI